MKQENQYEVTLTMIFNTTVIVTSASPDEACKMVHDDMDKYAPDEKFTKGEKTVDYANPIND